MLMGEAKRADKARAPQIATEVLTRYTNKKLVDEPLQRVIQGVLDLQADTARPWCEVWGDLIEQASTDGKVSKADQTRYRKQAPVLDFRVRPRLKAGEQVPVVAVL